jgi:hypothetical protein
VLRSAPKFGGRREPLNQQAGVFCGLFASGSSGSLQGPFEKRPEDMALQTKTKETQCWKEDIGLPLNE